MIDDERPRGVETVRSTLLQLGSPLADTVAAPPNAAGDIAKRPETPSRSERYEIVALLGEGGMGRVDRMRDRDLLRDVAAKRLLPELRSDSSLLAQFLWEARVTAYLDHPNIVPVHELGVTSDGEVFFTMKLARGATLESEIAKKEPGERALMRRLRSFLKVCDAVAFAHSRGVLHRDLKPANVLVGDFGEVLVSDWGLAVPLPGHIGEELRCIVPEGLSQRSAGTPIYMSPEQARGDELDARSDIYTLGAILYELVSFAHPVEGTSIVAVLGNVMRGEIIPITKAKPDVSSAIAAIVKKAMALAPADRYATAKELAEDIEIVFDGRTPNAEAAPLITKAARYYVGRDPAIGKMRVAYLDMWMGASWFIGAGMAAFCARWVGGWWWILLVAAVVIATPPTREWLRLRKTKDDV